jgi:hypothetical protein
MIFSLGGSSPKLGIATVFDTMDEIEEGPRTYPNVGSVLFGFVRS